MDKETLEFKEKAVSTYTDNIKKKFPQMSDYEIALITEAFKTGFNVGKPNYENEVQRQVALSMLSI